MPTPFDHALFVLLAVFFPIRSRTFGYRRLREAPLERVPTVRSGLYRQAIVLQWSFALAVVALWAWQRRPWTDLGLVWRSHAWSFALAAGFALLVAYLAVSVRSVLRDASGLLKVRRRLGPIERMLPRTDDELRAFYRLSFTAGVCEEILYRGYLFWYLGHWLPAPAVLPAAALLFGIGHSYQGRRGMLTTGLAGLALGMVYLLSGSLYLPMVLHALSDVYSGTIGRAALQAAEGEPYDSTGIAARPPEPAAAGSSATEPPSGAAS